MLHYGIPDGIRRRCDINGYSQRTSFLAFGSPLIGDEEIAEITGSLKSGWLGTGPKVHRFEDAFRAYTGSPHAAALGSCTAALHLSILAAGIGPGDEIITTPLTFCASVNAIIHAGATPVLADVDPVTMNIDPSEIERRITPRTRALLPVHFAGRACDMDAIMDIARRHGIIVIEDCAHAIETSYRGTHAGRFGTFGCFSFYATKNVTTGEGGMVLAQREQDIARVRILGLHGMCADAWIRYSDARFKHYEVVEAGFKYNMMDLQAAIGLHQLARVERSRETRMRIWEQYIRAFADLPVTAPAPAEPDTVHALHLFTLLIDEERCGIGRDAFLDAMIARNIGVGVHYRSIPEHPYYRQRYGWTPDAWPRARDIGRSIVSVPLSANMNDDDAEDVVAAVRDVLAHGAGGWESGA